MRSACCAGQQRHRVGAALAGVAARLEQRRSLALVARLRSQPQSARRRRTAACAGVTGAKSCAREPRDLGQRPARPPASPGDRWRRSSSSAVCSRRRAARHTPSATVAGRGVAARSRTATGARRARSRRDRAGSHRPRPCRQPEAGREDRAEDGLSTPCSAAQREVSMVVLHRDQLGARMVLRVAGRLVGWRCARHLGGTSNSRQMRDAVAEEASVSALARSPMWC